MGKRSLIFFFFHLLLSSASGQLRFGFNGGGAISSVRYYSKVETDEAFAQHTDIQKAINTFYGGISMQHKIGKKFSLELEVDYFKKGWKVLISDVGRVNNFRTLRQYELNYLQVPLSILLTTPVGHGRIYVGAGPYAALALNGSVEINGKKDDLEFRKVEEPVFTYLPAENYKPTQFINHYTINRIDYGLNGKIGYEFSFGLFTGAGIDIGYRKVTTSLERYDRSWNRSIRDPEAIVYFSTFHMGVGWMIN